MPIVIDDDPTMAALIYGLHVMQVKACHSLVDAHSPVTFSSEGIDDYIRRMSEMVDKSLRGDGDVEADLSVTYRVTPSAP